MTHQDAQQENLSHEEIKYQYHITRGFDFTRIELFRSARENYKEALKYRSGDAFALQRIDECNDQIRKDRKKVLILVPIVLALIALVIAINV